MTMEKRDEILLKISEDVKGLKVAVIGNGTIGLNDRVIKIEDRLWPSIKIVLLKRAVEVAAVAGIVGIIEILGSIIGKW